PARQPDQRLRRLSPHARGRAAEERRKLRAGPRRGSLAGQPVLQRRRTGRAGADRGTDPDRRPRRSRQRRAVDRCHEALRRGAAVGTADLDLRDQRLEPAQRRHPPGGRRLLSCTQRRPSAWSGGRRCTRVRYAQRAAPGHRDHDGGVRPPATALENSTRDSCREFPTGSAHQVTGHDRRGPRHQETTMPKYLLLKHYRGGPEPHRAVPPMDQWAPEDVEAHLAFLRHVSELLEKNGEYVGAQALTPERTWVRYGGPDAAPVTTDGPLPETSDLVAGWYMIDVESYDRAVEVAAYVSAGPGPGGEPLYEWIDIRELMSDAPSGD